MIRGCKEPISADRQKPEQVRGVKSGSTLATASSKVSND